MPVPQIILLTEDLVRLAAGVPAENRYPALERIWSRGRVRHIEARTPNHLRFALFGFTPQGDLPVAALTHVNDRQARPRAEEPQADAGKRDSYYYWLRADPVTMWAGMARVVMSSYGFADLDARERNEIELCVRDVLHEEGIRLHTDHPERWCIALDKPLDFGFTPLDEALGMDVADALPDHPEARYWRRILNEVQVALHNCSVNVRRRAAGKPEINSVWFWGGGFIPDATAHNAVRTVYADGAVSRGLAIVNDCRIRAQEGALEADFADEGEVVLVDWCTGLGSDEEELSLLEALVGRLLRLADVRPMELTVYTASGEGRCYDRSARRRFWRRSLPLSRVLQGV